MFQEMQTSQSQSHCILVCAKCNITYICTYIHVHIFFSFDDCHMWQLMAGTGAQMIITPTILPPIIVALQVLLLYVALSSIDYQSKYILCTQTFLMSVKFWQNHGTQFRACKTPKFFKTLPEPENLSFFDSRYLLLHSHSCIITSTTNACSVFLIHYKLIRKNSALTNLWTWLYITVV